MSEKKIISIGDIQKKRDTKPKQPISKKSPEGTPVDISAHRFDPIRGADASVEEEQKMGLREVGSFALLTVDPITEGKLQEKDITLDDIYADDEPTLSPKTIAMRELEKTGVMQDARNCIGSAVFHMLPFLDDVSMGGYLLELANTMPIPQDYTIQKLDRPGPSHPLGTGSSGYREIGDTFKLSNSVLRENIRSFALPSDKSLEAFQSIRTDQRNILHTVLEFLNEIRE